MTWVVKIIVALIAGATGVLIYQRMKVIEEKRKNVRLTIGITVFYNGHFSRTKNISMDGTFIKRNKQTHLYPIGSDISLSFDFSNRDLQKIEKNGTIFLGLQRNQFAFQFRGDF